MAKRNYTKRDEQYWEKVSQPKLGTTTQETTWAAPIYSEPSDCGDPFLATASISHASSRESTSDESRIGSRINRAAIREPIDKFSQIRQLRLPYHYRNDGVDIRDAIELTQKAYAHISSFKNAIDLMSEFSNTELYFKGGNKASRDFFTAWLKRIDIWSLKKHYFLEYFRSSNIFLYRVDADWTVEDLMKLRTVYAAEGTISAKKIPIRYIVLNPHCIAAKNTVYFGENMYEHILSQSELQRLKNPINEDDRKFFDGLPQEAKDLITKRSWTRDGIKIKIDPLKLHTSFAKKQPYEPFAIPFGFSVLGDINAKLEMKALDMAIMRTVEMAILHVKHGETKTQYGGGINQQMGEALKRIFQNGTVGRTLVTSYDVEAEFVIPDLQKVLGPEKYTIINQDIREGLQNIIVGEEKYGNTQAKINVFLEKLREARESFKNFLQAEIKRISKDMGFRVYPTCDFVDLSLQDNTELMRIATRLAELSILTPEQLMDVFKHGEFPDAEEIGGAQEKYVADKKKGYWNPLSPVATLSQPAPKLDPNTVYSIDNRPAPAAPGGSKTKPKAKGINKPAGRPSKASVEDLKSVSLAAQNLENFIVAKLTERHGELDADQKSMAHELMVQVISADCLENWESRANECLENSSKMLGLTILPEILECSSESGLDLFAAALYIHASEE